MLFWILPVAALVAAGFLPTSSGPYLVTAADINQDGHPDALLPCRGELLMPSQARPGNDRLTVYYTKGSPALADRKDYQVGFGPYTAVAGDLDQDGRADVMVANFQANDDRHMSVLWGQPGLDPLASAQHWKIDGGPFAYDKSRDRGGAPIYPTPGITSEVLVDVDRDGRLDMVAVAWSSDFFVVFHNQGKRSFRQRRYELSPGPRDVVAADFDGDGNPDLAFTIYSSNLVEIWHGDGKGAFRRSQVFHSQGMIPYDLKAGDIDSDGRVDLVVGNRGPSDNVSIFLNQKDGFRFFGDVRPETPQKGETTADEIRDVLLHDFDGDGHLDLFAACHVSHKVVLWRGTGMRAFGKLFTPFRAVEFPGKGPRGMAVFGGRIGVSFYDLSELGLFDPMSK